MASTNIQHTNDSDGTVGRPDAVCTDSDACGDCGHCEACLDRMVDDAPFAETDFFVDFEPVSEAA